MEIAHIADIEQIGGARTSKTVPIMTEEVMATVLTMGPGETLAFGDHKQDGVLHVVNGTGHISVGGKVGRVGKGSLILVPKGKTYFLCTSEDPMTVLSVRPVNGYDSNKQKEMK